MSQEYLTKKGMKAAKGLSAGCEKQTNRNTLPVHHPCAKSENANHTF
jgi:hypothetical protein